MKYQNLVVTTNWSESKCESESVTTYLVEAMKSLNTDENKWMKSLWLTKKLELTDDHLVWERIVTLAKNQSSLNSLMRV